MATVRPFNTFGPRQNEQAYAGVIPTVIRRALAGEEVLIHGDGDQTRDFNYVADVAELTLRVYETPATRGRVLNVASGREVSVNELVAKLLAELGVDVPVRHVEPRLGDVRRHLGSVVMARELTGFRRPGASTRGWPKPFRWYRKLLAPHG